jgi:uncharacterized protein (DUF2384 family)
MTITARSPKVPGKRGSQRKITRTRHKSPTLTDDTFQLRSFYDTQGRLAPERVAQALRMSKSQLAETIGVNREALYKPERSQAPKTQTRVREMVEIVERIKDWAGGQDQAIAWYRAQPIPAFGGRTAEALVKDGKAGVLRDYLDHLAMGGFA